MQIVLFYFICFCFSNNISKIIYWPIGDNSHDKTIEIKLTEIGHFGLMREPRPGIPEHYHTGIDIIRPNNNYQDEPIFPIAKGKVISKHNDGPYANLIIEHDYENKKFWTVYEHISGIVVDLNDYVDPNQPIAHFMNRVELNRYGWQFDHFHLEILKMKPVKLKPDVTHPELQYRAYTLLCYTIDDLNKYYYNPIEFLQTFPEILDK